MEPSTNADAVTVIEHANFCVSDPIGDIAPGSYHGFFRTDTRFLSRFEVSIDGRPLERLSSLLHGHRQASFYLTNPADFPVGPNALAAIRDREIRDSLRERIRLISYAEQPLELELRLAFDADFADIFEVRGRKKLRRSVRREQEGRRLCYRYDRAGYRRSTTVTLDRDVRWEAAGSCSLTVSLERGVPWELHVEVAGEESQDDGPHPLPSAISSDPEGVNRWAGRIPLLETGDARLASAWRQAAFDMASLLLTVPQGGFIPAAGVPWYLAVFGRDACIATMQTLLLGSELAVGTLRQLAAYQGDTVDPFRDEEPGKIPHEVRHGELSALAQVPHGRYYGSVDATPLYVMLFVEACRWSGWLSADAAPAPEPGEHARRSLPTRLRAVLPAVERAIEWIDRFGTDADGLVWYEQRSPSGIRNQVWKDSWDSYRFADGRIAEPPIAAVEVQGYVVAAKRGLAEVYLRLGRTDEAARLHRQAEALAAAIDERFWMAAEGMYAMGIDHEGAHIDSVTSNPGHLLWCGALTPRRAAAVAERLMAPDMFSGWGVRTMSTRMRGYNPISYHNGTVWPHDNSLIAAGLARYGHGQAAWRVVDALLDAADRDPHHRLPELFAGFDRHSTPDLVAYPTACAPQAWATGAIVLAAQTLLGFSPGDPGPRRPLPGAPSLRLREVRLAGQRIDLQSP